MLEINLAPQTDWRLRMQKRLNIRLPHFPIIPTIGGVLIFCVFIQTTLGAVIFFKQRSLNRLQARYADYFSYEASSGINDEIRQLGNELNALQKVLLTRSTLAPRLNMLSDLLPDGIWLTELSYRSKDMLIISGKAIGTAQQDTERIGSFVKALAQEPAYAAMFEEIELDQLERVPYATKEVTEFIIICKKTTEKS